MIRWIRYTMLIGGIMFYIISSGYGQDDMIRHEHSLGIEQGLSTRWVRCITEDHNKLIWVGTNKGVSRYDGFQFLNFNAINSNIRNESIYSILRDKQGLLWTIDKKQINQIPNQGNKIHEQFVPINIDVIDPLTLDILSFDKIFPSAPFRESDIRITEETEQGIWIGTLDYRYFLYDGTFHSLFADSLYHKYHYIALRDKQTAWATTDDAVTILDNRGNTLNNYNIPNGYTFLTAKAVKNSIWLVYISLTDNSIKLFTISENKVHIEISTAELDKYDGQYLFMTINQFQVIQQSENKYLIRLGELSFTYLNGQVTESNEKSKSIKTNWWFKDSYDNLWHTYNEGIKVHSETPNYFQPHLHNKKNKIETRAIYTTNENKLLISSYKGAFLINNNESHTEDLIPNKFPTVNQVIRYDENTFYAAGQMPGIYKFQLNPTSDIEFHTSADTLTIATTLTKDINQEAIWLGSRKGLLKYNIPTQSFEPRLDINTDSIFGQAEVTDLYYGDQGLWVATIKGLFLTNPDSAIIKRYIPEFGFPFSRIQHIYDDGEFFWLATNGHGLIKWDPLTEDYQIYTIENGLSNNYIHATYEDQSGFLWMPSDYGLMRMNKITNEVVTFTKTEGLTTNEFNRYSHYQDNNGKLFFGSIDGIIEFDPQKINESVVPNYNIVFTRIDVFNEQGDTTKSLLGTFKKDQSISLRSTDTYIDLEFAVTNFAKEKNYQFAYQIEGLDNSWKYTNNHSLEIARLPFGEFNLRIKGHGQGGTFSAKELLLPIHVKRPFYKTWLFALAMILLTLILIYAGIQYRLSILLKANIRLQSEVQARTAELHEVNKSKDKLFAVLAHDLRGPISSFKNLSKKVQYLISKNQWDTLNKMTDQIHSDTTRLDQLISNLIPWVLVQSKNPDIVSSTIYLSAVVEKSLDQLENNINDKDIKIINNTSIKSTVVADIIAVEIIIRNLLSNSIKFSHKGKQIEISTTTKENFTLLFIQDYGVGISQDALSELFSAYASERGTAGERGHGLGLKLARDLAVRNKGSLNIESTEGVGTLAILKLPQS